MNALLFMLLLGGGAFGIVTAVMGIAMLRADMKQIRASRHERALAQARMLISPPASPGGASAPALPPSLDCIPPGLRSKVAALAKQNGAGLGRHSPLASEASKLLALTAKLFTRLQSNGSKQQLRLAEVTYSPIVERLTELLSEAYYLDILANPSQWDDPKGRIAQVEEALVSVQAQLTDNLKQVNASRDLEFQAHLQTLGAYKATPRLDDVYKNAE